MDRHPRLDPLQHPRISAARIVGGVPRVGVLFAPKDPQPRRQAELVMGLLLVKLVHVLVLADQLLERASTRRLSCLDLLLD